MLLTPDLAALAFFLVAWVRACARPPTGISFKRVSLTTAMNAQRAAWMRTWLSATCE